MGKNSTNRVSAQLRDARESGSIPWAWIVDETREAESISAWKDPDAYCDTVKRAYRKDRWATQPCRVEVWSEKGTVRGTLATLLKNYGITFRVMHGFGSATTLYQIAQESLTDDRPFHALYVGDWDPSGLFMSEVDLGRRLAEYGGDVRIERVALTDFQAHNQDLPSFHVDEKGPTETSKGDPRYRWFRQHYGNRCWELDALDPVQLRDAVEQAVVERIDHTAWAQSDDAEQAELESLRSILSTWPTTSRLASKYPEGQR